SRQLYGLTIASERPGHRMMEMWHPLGVTGVISAFNFPVAVWAWNAALALVCGDPVVWKPSDKTPLTALAVQAIFARVAREFERESGTPAGGLLHVLTGGRGPAEALADHPAVRLVSATGSTAMGRALGPRLARRFARALLELGGNNGAIVCPSADQELALRAIAFAWMGTAGQRCTTLRRRGPVLRETFAPILYVMRYTDLDEAIAAHNAVAAGLSSSIFTRDAREAERFIAADGSDCGLANVNIGPSGAEIGGAFGG